MNLLKIKNSGYNSFMSYFRFIKEGLVKESKRKYVQSKIYMQTSLSVFINFSSNSSNFNHILLLK